MEWKGIKDHYSRRSQVMLPSNNFWSLSGLFSHSIMKTILALLRSQLNWRMMRVHSFLISRTFSSKASDTVDYSIQLDNVSSTGSHDIATPLILIIFLQLFLRSLSCGLLIHRPLLQFWNSEWSLAFPYPTKPMPNQFPTPVNYFLLTMSLIHVSSHYHRHHLRPGPQCLVLKLLQTS